jgi:drug/metabolite transporter (DMT)-like permease
MLPAFLTTIFFALSVIFAARSARLVGGTAANLGRMIVAFVALALWAHTWGAGLAGKKSLAWFFVSGCVGFGFGDIALFLALTRIGPRLTVLLAQCLAAPFGALAERIWLGTALRPAQLACGAVILLGVAIALAPEQRGDILEKAHGRTFWLGSFFGVLAALGQALGAVISRKAFAVAQLDGLHIDGGTAAYQRMLGGILITALFFVAVKRLRPSEAPRARAASALPWIVLNALAGPTIGVGCYQWALATVPGGIVLPIVATTPVVAIPLAWAIERDCPRARSIIGGLIAVAGTVALTRA